MLLVLFFNSFYNLPIFINSRQIHSSTPPSSCLRTVHLHPSSNTLHCIPLPYAYIQHTFILSLSKLGFKSKQSILAASRFHNFHVIMASFDGSSSFDSVSGDRNWTCGGGGDGDDLSYSDRERAEKFFLPIASVTRIMRIGVPKNWKITNDAKDAMQESVSEFISFITSEASCKCKRENRKTITGDDVLWAMSVLGFEDYMEPLKVYLAKYRKMEVIHAQSGHTKKHINS